MFQPHIQYSRSLINRSNLFAFGFVFTEIIASKVVKIGFCGVNDPAEIENEVQIYKKDIAWGYLPMT
jgi:hypothetical protein